MTITAETNVSGPYTGDGSTSGFAVNKRFLANADLEVVIETIETGAKTVQTLDTHYTVSGAGVSSGGAVTFSSDPDHIPTSAQKVHIFNWMDLTQETNYVKYDAFGAESHEEALDKLTLMIQQLSYILGGSSFNKDSWRLDSDGIPILPVYTNSTRPSAGTKGRQIWNSDDGKPNFDTGAAWVLADGTTT